MLVEIIACEDHKKLESKINDFIRKTKVIDIKYSNFLTTDAYDDLKVPNFSALIMYE